MRTEKQNFAFFRKFSNKGSLMRCLSILRGLRDSKYITRAEDIKLNAAIASLGNIMENYDKSTKSLE